MEGILPPLNPLFLLSVWREQGMMEATEPIRSSPILIAETNSHLRDTLSYVLRTGLPHVHVDVCGTQAQALQRLQELRYRTVVSSVHLTGADASFVKRNRAFQPDVPLIITAGAADKEPASRALDAGAFDLILDPLEPKQIVDTIRLALWHNQLLRLLQTKEKTVERYRQHMKAFPGDQGNTSRFEVSLRLMERTISAVGQSFDLVRKLEAAGLVTQIEAQTRAHALERLSALCREGVRDIHARLQAGPTVLIIDDDPQDLTSWSAGLLDVSPGYAVLKAGTVQAGLDLCRSTKVDCVVLDLDMNDASGFEALVSLVPDRARPTIPVVILTRLASRTLHDLAREHGARACLVKHKATAKDLSECIQKTIESMPPSTH